MVIFLIILFILFVSSLSSVITLWGDFKYYKVIYNSLDVNNFLPAYSSEYNHVCSIDGSFTWFANQNDFLLNNNYVYLHNMFVTKLNPYSLYWLYKYKKWFNDNCSHLKA